ncbi:MAG: hypothetical protein GY782_06520 [Gammaproteobacteria bacterium]|nr:hypothetical protein [Gammaproteobacteria bacterium]
MTDSKYRKSISHYRQQSNILGSERLEEYKQRVIAKANGQDIHDFNQKLGIVYNAVFMAKRGNRKYIASAEDAIIWLEKQTRVIGNVHWFVEL